MAWSRSLRDLGHREGLADRAGALSAFWTIPPAARAGRATFDIELSAHRATSTDESIAFFVNGMPMARIALAPGAHTARLSIDVPAHALESGVVRLDAMAMQAAERTSCGSAAKNATFVLMPATALKMDVAGPLNMEARLSLLPVALVARIPPGPLDPSTLRNIAVIAESFARDGHALTFTARNDVRAALIFAEPGDVTAHAGALVIPAAKDVANRFAGRAKISAPVSPLDATGIPLSVVGVSPVTQDVRYATEWTFALPVTALPENLSPRAITVELTAPLDPQGARQMLTLEVNDQLVASALLALRADARRVTFQIPEGAINAQNSMRLRFSRIGLDRVCDPDPAELPVSLSPASHIALGPAPLKPRQFFELSFASGTETILWIDDSMRATPERTLALMLAAMRSTVRNPERLSVRVIAGAQTIGSRPFVYLSRHPPAGAHIERLAEVNDSDSFAALIHIGNVSGLWLRPGPHSGDGEPLLPLERGSFARYDTDGRLLWYNSDATARQMIFSAEGGRLAQFIARYWPWTASLIWLFLAAMTLFALTRRRAGPQ